MVSSKPGIQLLCRYMQAAGLHYGVISPGSRHAPIVQTLHAMNFCAMHVLPDERAAGFFALGIADYTEKPSFVVVTSGTAVLNLAPAIAESYYRRRPMLIITADRPEKWIDNGDGQSIRQKEIFSNYVYAQYDFPQDSEYIASEAEQLLHSVFASLRSGVGPVHLNVPMDEPLYDFVEQGLLEVYRLPSHTDSETHTDVYLDTQLHTLIQGADRVMIVVGQQHPNERVRAALQKLSNYDHIVIVAENLANISEIEHTQQFDILYARHRSLLEDQQPDLVLQLGDAVVSKRLKQYLRKAGVPLIFFSKAERVPNMFDTKVYHLRGAEERLLEDVAALMGTKDSSYRRALFGASKSAVRRVQEVSERCPWCDLRLWRFLMGNIRTQAILHLANSSVVRYAQFFERSDLTYFGNRGVSGIDGSTSTALGYSYYSDQDNYLILGDMSFFYDSNAFWASPKVRNLKIIVINNGGGDIFKLIDGPDKSDIVEHYQQVPHGMSAQYICRQYDIPYWSVNSEEELQRVWGMFEREADGALIEAFTSSDLNTTTYREVFQETEDE